MYLKAEYILLVSLKFCNGTSSICLDTTEEDFIEEPDWGGTNFQDKVGTKAWEQEEIARVNALKHMGTAQS